MAGSRDRKRPVRGEKRQSLPHNSSEEWAESEGHSEDNKGGSKRKNDRGRGFSIWRRGDALGTTGLWNSRKRRRAQKAEPQQGQQRPSSATDDG